MGWRDLGDQRPHERGALSPTRVFLKPRVRVVAPRFTSQVHLRLAPVVNLHAVAATVARGREIVDRITTTTVLREVRRTELLALRLRRELVRVELDAPRGPSREMPASPPAASSVDPAPRGLVVVRQAPAQPGKVVEGETVARRSPSRPEAAIRVPTLDTERLAEQVIQTIDRRLQAHCERLGRR
jgi:hypothetical protein